MESSVKEKKTKTATVDKSVKIRQAFIEFVLEEGREPASVFKFMKGLRMKEASFYEYYASFDALQKEIWTGFFKETTAMLHEEEAYLQYSGREKMLAFYYTFIEVLKNNRSFVTVMMKAHRKPDLLPPYLRSFKLKYIQFVNDILNEAKETEEVIDRPLIGERYADALWLQLLFVVNFWIKDESKGFEKTDAAIEKAVNLSFDLMAKSPLDSMLDFAKFLFQNRD